MSAHSLVEQLKGGLDAPICLTWELTYACNLQCVHCLSSSGRRDPRELTTAEAKARDRRAARPAGVLHQHRRWRADDPARLLRARRATRSATGSASSSRPTARSSMPPGARRLAAMDYLDIQISLDGTDAATNDAVRGDGSYAIARRAMDHLRDAGFGPFKISVVVTRHNVDQLDEFKALADSYGAQLRVTRLRPSGRGADTWHELHPTNAQQRQIYDWLLAHGDNVLTGDSFFHLNALGEPLPGSQHVRRRACRVPDRPDRRRVRLPVRDPRRVQGRLGPRRRAASRRSGGTATCSASCANRSRPARARRAAATTRARAAAWPPSSSPACRSTVPTPSASAATASCALVGAGQLRRGRRWTTPAGRNRAATRSRSSRTVAVWVRAAPGGVPARNVPERGPRRPRQRHRHHRGRIGQPGRLERHPRARLAQGRLGVRARRR